MRGLRSIPFALAMVALVPVSAAAGGPTLVSGVDPYADCSLAHQTGTNDANAEVEPSVTAISASALVGAWQQDRWSNGGASGLVAGFSKTGGKSWSQSTLPFSGCAPGAVIDPFTGGPYDRASDAWVSAG